MLRPLYVRILRFHPAAFRERFGDEMLDIFDQAVGSRHAILLIGDAFVSLLRQWALRSDFHEATKPAVASGECAGALMFQPIADYKLRPSALLQATGIAVLALCTLLWAVGKGAKTPNVLIGVHHPHPHVLAVDRASVAETEPTTTVRFAPTPEDPWRAVAAVYFKLVRVLDILDADKDLIISPWEMLTAPAALRRLDTDHDGKLSPEECGLSLGAKSTVPPSEITRFRRTYMLGNPVLAALDKNHDGQISAEEIEQSASSLKRLDRNGDGSLTADEVLPDQDAIKVATIMVGLDQDGDGRISRIERRSTNEQPQDELLDAADRNHDGIVTRRELAAELKLRAERKHQLERAQAAAGIR